MGVGGVVERFMQAREAVHQVSSVGHGLSKRRGV
jgi:hypothetical protein